MATEAQGIRPYPSVFIRVHPWRDSGARRDGLRRAGFRPRSILHEVQQLDRLAVLSREEMEDEAPHLDGRSFEQANVRRQAAKRKMGIEEEGEDIHRRLATPEGEIEGAIIGLMAMQERALEIRAESPKPSGGHQPFERVGGSGAIGFRDSEHDQKVRASIADGVFDGDGIHDAAIHIEAIADAHGMGIEEGQSGAGFERSQQIEFAIVAAEEDFAPGPHVGRDDIERRSIRAHAREIEPLSARDDLLKEEVHVHDLPQPREMDEAAVGDVLVVDRSAEGGLSSQEVCAVDSSGRSAVDGIEGVGEAELLQSDDRSGAGDAAHGAALEDAGRFGRDGGYESGVALDLPFEDVVQGDVWPKPPDAVRERLQGLRDPGSINAHSPHSSSSGRRPANPVSSGCQ
mgnify:CR=1 FL=1